MVLWDGVISQMQEILALLLYSHVTLNENLLFSCLLPKEPLGQLNDRDI